MELPNIPPEMIQEKLLFSATPPAVAVAATFLVGALAVWLIFGVWRKTDWRKGVPAVAVLALAAGLVVVPLTNGHFQAERKAAREIDDRERVKHITETYKFEETFPLVPDGKWWHWGLYAVGLALLVELIARAPGVPVAVGHLFRGVAAGVIASAVLPPDWQKGADRWILPLTAAVMAVQDAVSRKTPGWTLAACLSLVAGGAACVAIHDGSARFTDFATFVASALFVLAVGGWILRADVGGGVAIVPVLTVLLMVREEAVPTSPDDLTKHVPVAAYWLVASAPLLPALFLLPRLTRFGTKWYSAFVKLLLVLIPVGIAVYLCLSEAPLQLGKEEW
jgi:hypothetical protein